MAKLDLQKLLNKRGWKLSDLSKATGISRTVLRMLGEGIFPATGHENRLILEALAKPEPAKPGAKAPEAPAHQAGQAGQLDLFGGS